MQKTPLEIWLGNKEKAICKFFEELKTIDAPAYLEIPLSFEEWKKEKDVRKMAVVVLFTLWLNDVDLANAWEGWFYKEGRFLIMIEPNGNDYTLAIVNRKTGKVFVETYSVPRNLEPLFLIDTEGVLNED